MMTHGDFRNSPKFILARLLRDVWRVAALLVALQAWGMRFTEPWPTILRVVVVVVVAAFVIEPVGVVLFKRLRLQGDELVLRVGLIAPMERTSALTAVSSVQVDEPWYLRALGLRTVTIAAQGVESFVMEGLRADDAARLTALAEHAPPSAVSGRDPEPDAGPGPDAAPVDSGRDDAGRPQEDPATERHGDVAYTATRRDLAATIVSQGTLVLAIGAIVGLAEEVGGLVGLDVVAVGLRQDGWVLALVAVGLVAVSSVVAALRFGGFAIERTPAGAYRVAYGAVERTAHTVRRDQVVAVGLVTTPLDALMGTTRVVLSTAALRGAPMGEVRFPSLRRRDAVRIVREVTGVALPELDDAATRRSAVVPVLALLVTTGVVALLPRAALWLTAAEAVVVLVLVVLLLQYLTGRALVAADGSYVVWSRVGLSRTTTAYSAGCARAVVLRRAWGLQVGTLTLVGFAHRREVRRKPVRSPELFTALRRVQANATTRPWTSVPTGRTT